MGNPGEVRLMDGMCVAQGLPTNSIAARLDRIERLLLILVERDVDVDELATLDDLGGSDAPTSLDG